MIVKCGCCGIDFEKSDSEIKRKPHQKHFCSRECYFESLKCKTVAVCANCGKEHKKTPSNLKKYKLSFCSKVCQKLHTISRNDFTGKKLGRCTVLKEDEESTRKERSWLILCSCGEKFSRRHKDIKMGLVYECPNCIFRRSQYHLGGKKFGRLSVTDKYEFRVMGSDGKRFRHWLCKCECGNEVWVCANSITRDHTLSCGCYMQKNNSRYVNETLYPIRHGKSGKYVQESYTRWITLVHKCHNTKHYAYKRWGAKGYTVCESWRNDFSSFDDWLNSQNFMGNLTIAIKEGKREFSPMNCYLEDIKNYHKKLRSESHLSKYGIEYNGMKMTLRQWANYYQMSYYTLAKRYRFSKDLEKCFKGNWLDGSGVHFKRHEISDDLIKEMYERGMTIEEIQNQIGFKGVHYRLKKMKVKMRPASR